MMREAREARWKDALADEVADVLIAALADGGVEYLFFNSGSDVLVFQEAVAKAESRGALTPKLITVLHETVGLNGALGFAAVAGRPAATAAHVEVGLLNYGCALHAAKIAGAPVVILGGSPPRAYRGTLRGDRDEPIYWQQEQEDQRALARQYAKWVYRLEMHDNPGLVMSRALQVALSPPTGPAFVSIPREVAMAPVARPRYPSVAELGIARPSAPDPAAVEHLAEWLVAADRPLIITGRNGRDPRSVGLLVDLAESIGCHVTDNGYRYRVNFPSSHPLMETGPLPIDSDLVLVLDRPVPWVPGGELPIPDDDHDQPAGLLGFGDVRLAPSADCRIAWIGEDPVESTIPMLDLSGDLRITAAPTPALEALVAATADLLSPSLSNRALERIQAAESRKKALIEQNNSAARKVANQRPIDPRWVAFVLGRVIGPEAIVLDESLSNSPLVKTYLTRDRPSSYFTHEGSGGGWGSGAALGAKLAEPDRDVVLLSGDGFYTYGAPDAALWTAVRYDLAFLTVIFVNRRYSTGTSKVHSFYPGGYAEAAGFPGGVFDPPPDFAASARAVGAHGVNVDDPTRLEGELKRGLEVTRSGQPAVIAVHVS